MRYRERCNTVFATLVCLILIGGGCASHHSRLATDPGWYLNPNPDSGENFHFVTKAVSAVSHEAARQEALRNIRIQIAERISTSVKVGTGKSAIQESEVEIFNVSIGSEEYEVIGSEWVVWMMGSYPKEEYRKILERFELARELTSRWSEARSAIDREEFADAGNWLLEIIDNYERAARLSFKRDEVKLELAKLYGKQKHVAKAWQWLDDVIKNTADPDIKRAALSMSNSMPKPTVRDAFDGKLVALCCFRQIKNEIAAESSLTQQFNDHFLKSGIKIVSGTIPVLPDNGIQDKEWINGSTKAARSAGAAAVFVAVLRIDPDKTGKMVAVPFSKSETAALDATLNYTVIRASDGKILAGGTTRGHSTNIESLVTIVMSHNRHLPQKALAISKELH